VAMWLSIAPRLRSSPKPGSRLRLSPSYRLAKLISNVDL